MSFPKHGISASEMSTMKSNYTSHESAETLVPGNVFRIDAQELADFADSQDNILIHFNTADANGNQSPVIEIENSGEQVERLEKTIKIS